MAMGDSHKPNIYIVVLGQLGFIVYSDDMVG